LDAAIDRAEDLVERLEALLGGAANRRR